MILLVTFVTFKHIIKHVRWLTITINHYVMSKGWHTGSRSSGMWKWEEKLSAETICQMFSWLNCIVGKSSPFANIIWKQNNEGIILYNNTCMISKGYGKNSTIFAARLLLYCRIFNWKKLHVHSLLYSGLVNKGKLHLQA